MHRCSARPRPQQTVVAATLSLLLLVGLIVAPTDALAASENSEQLKPSVAERFDPPKPNRTPIGKPLPPNSGELQTIDPQNSDKTEVAERRTQNSKTFVNEEGMMVTEFFQNPVHYRDEQGRWQPIDPTLVRSNQAGVAAQSAAGDVTNSVPSTLGSGPARVTSGEHFVEFSLDSATGHVPGGSSQAQPAQPAEPQPSPQPQAPASPAPSPAPQADEPEPTPEPSPTPETSPVVSPSPAPSSTPSPQQSAAEPEAGEQPAAAESPGPKVLRSVHGAADLSESSTDQNEPSSSPATIDGQTATYEQVFEGVDVVYTSEQYGLKEEMILHSAAVPTDYDYKVSMSPALVAQQTDTGIEFVDDAGEVWGGFSDPFVADAGASLEVPLQGVDFDAVTLEILSQQGSELKVRLSIGPDYLNDQSREFPLVIDPSLWTGTSGFTFITNLFPDTNFDDYPGMGIYGDPYPYRILAKPIVDFKTFFKEPVQITDAYIQLAANTDTTAAAAKPVGVYEVTKPWNSWSVTWNQRKAGLAWTTPGGEIAAQPESVLDDITGAPAWHSWSILSMVNKWKDGAAYNGMMIKYVDDSKPAPSINFAYHSPLIRVFWVPQIGLHDPYSFQSFDLGESTDALVGIASGSLKLTSQDLSLTGTGLDMSVLRGYESRSQITQWSALGSNWFLSPHTRLYSALNGDIYWVGGPEQWLAFRLNPDGTYRSPQGYRGTLAKDPQTGAYAIALHESATTINFTAAGYQSSTKDRNGNQITFYYTYNAALDEQLMTSLADTKGQVTTFSHNAEGEVTKITDPAGRTVHYGYNSAGLLASFTDAAGKQTTYEYLQADPQPALPPVTKITDPNGIQTIFSYENTDALYTASPSGTSIFDPTWRLDKLTRVTNNSTGAGHTWDFGYSPGQTTVEDPNGHLTTYTLDTLGRVTQTKDHLGKTTKTAYNAQGFVTSVTDQDNQTTDIVRDALNNVRQVVQPSGMDSESWYTDAAHPYYPTQGQNAQGHSVNLGYDSPGNLSMRQNQLPANNQLDIEHNPNGTVSKTTDGMGNETNYVYFANGDLKQINRPLGVGNQSFTYDNLSRVSTVTDAKGQVTEFTYDVMDRVTRVDYADDSAVVNGYDDGGRLVRREDVTGTGLLDPTHVTTFGYDALNRQTTKNVGGVTYTSTFDGVGNLKTLTDPSGTVSYAYNAVDLLTTLTEPSGAVTTFGYDGAYRRNLISYPNGVTQTTVYDSDGMVSSIVGKKADGTTLTSFGYNYHDQAGNKTELVQTLTEPAGQTSYTYDVVDRLTKAQGPHGTFEYGFDGNWNLTSKTVGGQTTGYAYNGADQITVSGATTYAYDQNGNLTATSAGPTLAYNAKDQMTGYTAPGLLGTTTLMEYLDTGQFERIQAGGTTFSTGPLGLASSTDAAVVTTNYVRDSNGGLVARKDLLGTQYYLYDRLGSVVALTDASGNAVNTYVYDPYGNHLAGTTEAVANPWQFAGGFKDSFSGYYKFGTRYYDPEIGRWTQPDPSGFEANSYAYAAGNPVNFVDPSGLIAWRKFFDGASTALGVAAAGARYFAPACPWCAAGLTAASFGLDAGIVGYECFVAKSGRCANSVASAASNQGGGRVFRGLAKYALTKDGVSSGIENVARHSQAAADLASTAGSYSIGMADRWSR